MQLKMEDGDCADGWPGRWAQLDRILERSGRPSAPAEFQPSPQIRPQFLQEHARVLVVGAGGLGCELLKDLALSGFRNIDVIDMDTIDYSNLNRQFLFRERDVGRSKAEVAAEFVNTRVPGCQIVPHCCKIQDKDSEFYRQFHIIVAGLDSIEARRWLNSTVQQFYLDDNEVIVPIVDGGTEGFKGQVRVIIPGQTACFECTMSLYPPKRTYPLCTIANTPRLPEHCIEYARIVQWEKEHPEGTEGTAIDTDNPAHMQWLYERALERAEQYNIPGVTLRLTQGVVKNIIPAVAATNAIIAGACANEVFKLATGSAPLVENYMFYNGTEGAYAHTFEYFKDPMCLVCGQEVRTFTVKSSTRVADLAQDISTELNLRHPLVTLRAFGAQFGPDFQEKGKSIYMENPPALRKSTAKNLERSVRDLNLITGTQLTFSSADLVTSMKANLVISDE